MTAVELLTAIGIAVASMILAYWWGRQSGRAEANAARSELSDAKERVSYFCSMATKGLDRNRGRDESPESFVREYIVRLESAEAVYKQALTLKARANATGGVVEGEHHA